MEFDERPWGAMVDKVTVGVDGGMAVVFWDKIILADNSKQSNNNVTSLKDLV